MLAEKSGMQEIHAVNEMKPKRGRKPRLVPRKAITVRLEPRDADGLRLICNRRRLSQAKWVAEKIRVENDQEMAAAKKTPEK